MTTTKPTLTEMSDFLAEKLLGWRRVKGAYWDEWRMGNGAYFGDSSTMWQPHNSIEQCFTYIIPALMGSSPYWYGIQLSFDKIEGGKPDNSWAVYLWEDSNGNTLEVVSMSLPAAIVEAAYLAIRGMD